jgi:hypothetical protein
MAHFSSSALIQRESEISRCVFRKEYSYESMSNGARRPDFLMEYLCSVGRGLGYLLENVPAVLKALYGPAARAAVGEISEPGVGAPRAPATVPPAPRSPNSPTPVPGVRLFTWDNPPAGATRPPEMNGIMPVYPQETPTSCGPACARAITSTVRGVDVGESPFRQSPVWTNQGGAWPQQIKAMLDAAGVSNSGVKTGQTLDQLAQGAKNGPIVIGTGQMSQTGSLVGLGHAKILDGVSGVAPNRFFWVRDPMNLNLEPPLIREFFEAVGFNGHEVIPEVSFSHSFLGEAIYTKATY